jgi:hypothetical protein
MPRVRLRISVSGFTEAEARAGIPDLLAEFRERPWLLRTSARWDDHRGRLVVTVEREGDDRDFWAEANFDEVRDCVIACVNFSSEGIHFDLEDSAVVKDD